MNIAIYKFGGTAMATPQSIRYVVDLIAKRKEEKCVVVVSAMGRSGFPYATDTFLKLLKEQAITRKETDRLLSCGEIISSVYLSASLKEQNISAYALSYLELGFHARASFQEAIIDSMDDTFYFRYFESYDVLIVPGFLAQDDQQEVITLGRGSSDVTAVALARLLQIKEVTFFKDVEGVYPFLLHPMRKVLPYTHLSYEEMEILSSIGPSVLHAKAIQYAKEDQITLSIRSFMSNTGGTMISEKGCNRSVLGFFIDHQQFRIACRSTSEVADELKRLLQQAHAFVKDEIEEENLYAFTLHSSQGLLIKNKVIQMYFSSFLQLG